MTDRPTVDSTNRPFVAAPHPSRYFPGVVCEEARLRITRSIQRGEGPALLIGGAGTGKTMMLEVLAQQFRDSLTVLPVAGAQLCTRRALLQMILFQLGLPYRGLDEGELRLSLLSHLRPEGEATRRILLLVDEAESLPDRLLEELRVLTNIAVAGQPLVSLVLVGSPILEERFAEPKLEVFSQRISSRSYLAPLGREETKQYVRAQVAAVGQDPQAMFANDGLEAIIDATDGVPRLINQLCDQLMWMAQETGYAPLDAEIVQQAWSELQQLPAPWNSSPLDAPGTPVAFGELDMSSKNGSHDDEMPASIPMNSQTSHSTYEVEITNTLETADQILEQIDNEESLPAEEATSANSIAPARNPFLEEFESEELVLDRYSTFEEVLLQSATEVMNQKDTMFAQQLRQCEVAETYGIVVQDIDEDEQAEDETQEQEWIQESTSYEDSEESPSNPGDLLVVEDEYEAKVEVVPAKQFRQLFSTLQA